MNKLKRIKEVIKRIEIIQKNKKSMLGQVWTKEYLQIVINGVNKKSLNDIENLIVDYFITSNIRSRHYFNEIVKDEAKKINVILRTKNKELKNKRIKNLINRHFNKIGNLYLASMTKDYQAEKLLKLVEEI